MGDFSRCMEFTLQWEGGLSNDPGDPGGLTYRGLCRRAEPSWDGWPIVEDAISEANGNLPRAARALDADVALQAMALDRYRAHYWEPIKGDQRPWPVSLAVFDAYVNGGGGVVWQEALNTFGQSLTVDGRIGPRTLLAALSVEQFDDPREIALAVCDRRANRFERIIAKNPRLAKFRRGWLNRVDDLRRVIRGLPMLGPGGYARRRL